MTNTNATDDAVNAEANHLLTTIAYTLFGVVGIAGNGLVLLVIALVDDLRDITNLFIANQSLIDLILSVLLIASYVVPLPSIPSHRTFLADVVCKIWYTRYPFWALIISSAVNFTLMTLERYYAVFFPLRFHTRADSRFLKLIVILPWAIGLFLDSFHLFSANVEENICIVDSSVSRFNLFAVGILEILIGFFLPVLVACFVYTSIAVHLRQDAMQKLKSFTQASKSDTETELGRVAEYRRRGRKNTIKTLMIVAVFFIICWSLNDALVVLDYLGMWDGLKNDSLLYRISVFMGFCNIWINPFIYSFQYRRFQKGLTNLFCKRKGKGHCTGVGSISLASTTSK